MQQLTKIEDRFEAPGQRLVVVPGPLQAAVAAGSDLPVELRRPDGTSLRARATLQHISQTPPAPLHIAAQWGCILIGVTKEDVPVGTEVWASESLYED